MLWRLYLVSHSMSPTERGKKYNGLLKVYFFAYPYPPFIFALHNICIPFFIIVQLMCGDPSKLKSFLLFNQFFVWTSENIVASVTSPKDKVEYIQVSGDHGNSGFLLQLWSQEFESCDFIF
jgi:hypothetical protein